jgi:hypothetical protein
MKLINFKIQIAITLLFLIVSLQSKAQAPGSESVYGGSLSVKSITSAGISSDVSESLYVGAGTHVIDGTWEIYAKQIVIDPAAIITGTGTIILYNPSVAGGAASPTLIDGNASSNAIDVNIQLQNASGMKLTNIAFPSTLTASSWTDNASASSLYIGKDLSLAIDGADVQLGTGVVGDLTFDADATISNYRPSRMVIVNNDILSHMVKESFTSAFVFPVGISDGDYTPAQISNVSAITVSLSVQDYVASASTEATTDPGPAGIPADGMKRTWHIFANTAGTGTTINLQHNLSTNQSGFFDASHFVTRWGSIVPNITGDFTAASGVSGWQTNTAASGAAGSLSTPTAVVGASMRGRSYASLATTATAPETYFSKSTDIVSPLPVTLVSFDAAVAQCTVLCNWTAGVENKLDRYELQHSTNGVQFITLSTYLAKGSNSHYSFVHQSPSMGTNLYRLMMVDKDQNFTFSNLINVKVECDGYLGAVKVYPNPSAGLITVEGTGNNRPSVIRIINMQGQIVQEIKTNHNSTNIDISALASASYMLQLLQNETIQMSVKITKQ